MNQAWAGHPGRLVMEGGPNDPAPAGPKAYQVWAKAMPEGGQAVFVVNQGKEPITVYRAPGLPHIYLAVQIKQPDGKVYRLIDAYPTRDIALLRRTLSKSRRAKN